MKPCTNTGLLHFRSRESGGRQGAGHQRGDLQCHTEMAQGKQMKQSSATDADAGGRSATGCFNVLGTHRRRGVSTLAQACVKTTKTKRSGTQHPSKDLLLSFDTSSGFFAIASDVSFCSPNYPHWISSAAECACVPIYHNTAAIITEDRCNAHKVSWFYFAPPAIPPSRLAGTSLLDYGVPPRAVINRSLHPSLHRSCNEGLERKQAESVGHAIAGECIMLCSRPRRYHPCGARDLEFRKLPVSAGVPSPSPVQRTCFLLSHCRFAFTNRPSDRRTPDRKTSNPCITHLGDPDDQRLPGSDQRERTLPSGCRSPHASFQGDPMSTLFGNLHPHPLPCVHANDNKCHDLDGMAGLLDH